ncbi:DUF192 domain-containing protein [Oscillospiraceae bacterium CM]|nr:DUF192 domain-containing protein [Oscillospiraceae bacterium CM]
MKVICGDTVLADKIILADSFFKRFKGLMGKKSLEDGEGLLLNTASIHCFFMKLTIDTVYISKNLTVLGKETLSPWRVGKWFGDVKYILELKKGAAATVSVGDRMILEL